MEKEGKDILYWKKQMAYQQKLQRRLENLKVQYNGILSREKDLQTECQTEQFAVEKLQQKNTANLFRKIIGKQGEQIEEKEKELLFSQEKYEALQKERQEIKQEMETIFMELQKLSDCEMQYETAIQSAIDDMTDETRKQHFQEILAKQKEIVEHLAEQEELLYSINTALYTVRAVLQEIEEAYSWSKWDISAGGTIFSDVWKHKHLKKGQQLAADMRLALQNLEQKCNSVKFAKDFAIKEDNATKWKDYFGFIWHDWEVHEDIVDVKQKLQKIKWQLEQLYQDTKQQKSNAQAEKERLEEEWLECLL